MSNPKGKNWSWGIFAVYTVFALFLLGFWYFSTFHKVEMVADNYYEQTLKYQTRIDKIQNANNLPQKPYFYVDKKTSQLILVIPGKINFSALRGKIKLFRPSDASKDQMINLLPDQQGRQIVPIAGLAGGKWRVQMEWADGEKEYYLEQVMSF